MMRSIVTGFWIVFCLYWLVSARKLKPVRERVAGLRGLLWKIPVIAGVALIGDFFKWSTRAPVLSTPLVPRTPATDALVVVLLTGGLVIAFAARKTLAGNWSGSVTFKEGHELITTGLYRYVRHPIYSGVLLMLLGNVFYVGSLDAFLGFPMVTVGFWEKLRQEEELLTSHFATEYPAYKQRTKALIPFVL